MKLSVIVPVYNVEKYLSKCLDSIFSQGIDAKDYEVICINDGSTDNSLSILEHYRSQFSNLIIFSQKNRGVSAARNEGITLSSGRYLFFVDSDDYIANNTLKRLLDILDHTELDMLCFKHLETESYDMKEPRFSDCSIDLSGVMTGREFFCKKNPNNSAWDFLICKDYLIQTGIRFFENKNCEDVMFSIMCFDNAKRVAQCNIDVYRYVQRSESITKSRNTAHMRKMVEDFSFVIDYINGFVKNAEEECQLEYMQKLIERRDNYFFFFQIRMMRARLSKNEIKSYLSRFRENGCYPNHGLTPDYGMSRVLLSKLLQIESVYYLFAISFD